MITGGTSFDDPQLLNVLFTHFYEGMCDLLAVETRSAQLMNDLYLDVDCNHLAIFDTGVCMEMHLFNHYLFQIRDFGTAQASCLVFHIQPAGEVPDPQRKSTLHRRYQTQTEQLLP